MSQLSWDNLLDRFLGNHSVQDRTGRKYRENFRDLLAFHPVAGPLELTQDQLKAYYLHLRQSTLLETSVVSRMRGLQRVLRWAFRRGLLLLDPTHDFPIPKPHRRIPRPLTGAEISLLIEATGHHPRRFSRLRDRAQLELLYGTGMRIGEVAGLEVNDLDLADLSLTIRISKGRPRRVPFGEQVAATLKAYLEARERVAQPGLMAVFVAQNGTRLSLSRLSQIVSRYGEKTGIPVSAHGFRRAFATHLLENGANLVEVKTLLGHVDLDSTRFYTDIAPAELTRAYQHSHPRARRTR